MTSVDPSIGITAALLAAYGMTPTSMERIYKGQGTRNWKVVADERSWFVKEYHTERGGHRASEALDIAEFARSHGVPTPAVLRSRDGALLGRGAELLLAVFEYMDGSTYVHLNSSQMAAAGALLGQIHAILANVDPSGFSQTAEFLSFDLAEKRQELDAYVSTIERKAHPDSFDIRTLQLLKQRREQVRLIPELLAVAGRGLTTQVVHGDYSTPNILFTHDDRPTAIDFNAPSPFLVAYELGRIAFTPNHFQLDDWKARAFRLVASYCRTCRPRKADVIYAPHMWLVQLLRSTYGLKQHYTGAIELQDELDLFWFARCRAATVLIDNLVDLENELRALV